MLGRPTPYREVPWFWSDQYDLKLQIAGLAREGDEIVLRGDPAARKFAVFHLREGLIAAVEAVNAAPEYIVGRKLIAEGTAVAPARLADLANPDEIDCLISGRSMPKINYVEHTGKEHVVEVAGWLVGHGRRRQEPHTGHRCGLRRRLRLRDLSRTCRSRLGRQDAAQTGHGRHHARFRAGPRARRAAYPARYKVSPALDGLIVRMPASQH